jgi:hypothetical protein
MSHPVRCRPAAGSRLVLALLVLLAAGGLPLPAEAPADVAALLAAKKAEEACLRIYALVPESGDTAWLELARLAYDHDPDLERLKQNLRDWTEHWTGAASQAGAARLLGQLALTQRDYRTAQWAWSRLGEDPEAVLKSSSLLLLMGRKAEARADLVQLLSRSPDALVIEKASCLLAWLVWSEGQGKTGLEILANKKSAQALYLTAVLARSLGLRKDDQAARERLARNWPQSVWTKLAEPEADPAIQVDTTLLILTGLGAAAAGDLSTPAGAAASVVGNGAGKPPTGDDSPAKAIQVGYFKDTKNARKLADSLNAKGFMAQVEDDRAGKRYKVMVLIRPGQDPQSLILQLKDIGLEGFLVF